MALIRYTPAPTSGSIASAASGGVHNRLRGIAEDYRKSHSRLW